MLSPASCSEAAPWRPRSPQRALRKAAKDHGTQKLVEGASALAPGARVAVVEDVVTTGGSTLAALEVLRGEGLEIAGVVAVVDRLEGGADAIRAAGVSFVSLYDRSDFVDLGQGASTTGSEAS